MDLGNPSGGQVGGGEVCPARFVVVPGRQFSGRGTRTVQAERQAMGGSVCIGELGRMPDSPWTVGRGVKEGASG